MGLMIKVYGKIYLITNLVNGKKYVGQTIRSVESRLSQHISCANGNDAVRRKAPLYRAIRKHGKENFSVRLLCSCSSQDELNLMEDLYIASLGTLVDNGGYNLRHGGSQGKASESTKIRIRLRMRGSNHPKYLHHVKDSELISLYKKGNGIQKIARMLGLRRTTVEQRLKKSKIPMRRRGTRSFSEEEKRDISSRMKLQPKGKESSVYRQDIDSGQLVDLYSQGHSTVEISSMLSVSVSAISDRLKKANVVLRSQGFSSSRKILKGKDHHSYRHDIATEEIVRLYKQGFSTPKIGEIFGITARTARLRLMEAGVTLRSCGAKTNIKY